MALSPSERRLQSTSKIVRRRWADLPFRVKWRTAVVRLPRLTPRWTLRFTSPEGPHPIVVDIPSRNRDAIPVWVFLPPLGKLNIDRSVALHIDFHGGGFFMGSCIEQAPFCAKIARERGCLVLCPDYSMAPFKQFPSALEDAEDVLSAALDARQETEAGTVLHTAISRGFLPRGIDHKKSSHRRAASEIVIDTTRISFSGFSSGGNIAFNLVTSVTGEIDWPCRIPPSIGPIPVLLYYPCFHHLELPAHRPKPPHVRGPGKFAHSLDKNLVPMYFPERLHRHPRANPGLIDPHQIHKNARIFLVATEYDSLFVQTEAWVDSLHRAEGVADAEVFKAKGMKHGWANFPEKLLDTRGRRMKKEVYAAMMDFWDRTLADWRTNEGKQGGTGDVEREKSSVKDDTGDTACPVVSNSENGHAK